MINPEPSAPVDDETAGSGEKGGLCAKEKASEAERQMAVSTRRCPGEPYFMSTWIPLYVLVRFPCQRAAFWLVCSL